MKSGKTGIIYKIWDLLLPLVLYYAVYVLSYLILSFCFRAITDYLIVRETAFLTGQEMTLAGVINGMSMLAGALVLMPMLREELQGHRARFLSYKNSQLSGREVLQDGRKGQNRGEQQRRRNEQNVFIVILTIILAVSSSIGLNILLTLTGFAQSSEGYQEVAQSQYSVAIGVGVVLYAVVSPVAEEIVFRGIIYNRMRRYFGEWLGGRTEQRRGTGAVTEQKADKAEGGLATAAAIVLSGILFGVYHGNTVQGVYGGCMGILMAYMYERTHAFYIPCLFHAAANCVVYLTAQNAVLHGRIFTPLWCLTLLGISLILILVVEKRFHRDLRGSHLSKSA